VKVCARVYMYKNDIALKKMYVYFHNKIIISGVISNRRTYDCHIQRGKYDKSATLYYLLQLQRNCSQAIGKKMIVQPISPQALPVVRTYP
jgi:hypothetical protein